MLTKSSLISRGGHYIPGFFRPVLINLVITLQKLEIRYRSLFAREHPNPVFILGNQKSGTSAVTALLSYLSGCSASVDLMMEYLSNGDIYSQVYLGQKPFSALIKRNRYDFSKSIIKEANLTIFYPELYRHFPNSRFVFVVRNPKDNIRSILNRLNLPGDLEELTPEQHATIPDAWRSVFDGKWLNLKGQTYIEILAERWKRLTDIYFQNRERFILTKYEDFLKDKVGEIKRLGDALSLEQKNDISSRIDIQYQPKGQHSVSVSSFFGPKNLLKIETLCRKNMEKLDYLRI